MNSGVIAKHLNVTESAILRLEEWSSVVFAVVKGLGARFVSKKIIPAAPRPLTAEQLEAVGGSRWTKNDMDRVYFEIANFVDLSNGKARKLSGAKLFYDLTTNEFRHTATVCRDEVMDAIYEIKSQARKVAVHAAVANYRNMMQTSTGEWVTPDQWDEIEGSR
jgi:hypothetical protein